MMANRVVRRRPLSAILLSPAVLLVVPCASFIPSPTRSGSLSTSSLFAARDGTAAAKGGTTAATSAKSKKVGTRKKKSAAPVATKIGVSCRPSNGTSRPLKGQRAAATPEPLLDALPPSKFDERWNRRYEELEAYKRLHGDCLVPQTYPPNPALGRWVRSQRVQYRSLQKGNDSYITPDRVSRLNALGFVWDANEATWRTRLGELRAYHEEHGNCNVPQNDEVHKKLASWVQNQRMQWTYLQRGEEDKSALTPERIEALEELGFLWDAQEASWMEKFSMLEAFHGEHGHSNVPSQYKENMVLARWVLQIRVQMKERKEQEEKEGKAIDDAGDEISVGDKKRKKKRGRKSKPRLTQKRIDLLNTLDFVWDPHDFFWWERYNELKAYKEEHGHCSVPAHYAPNPKLGNWVNNQRSLCSHYADAVLALGTSGADRVPLLGLNEERLEAFKAIDFCYLPSAEDIAAAALKASQLSYLIEERKEAQAVKTEKQQVKPVEKKAFVPFPWDEI